MSIPAAGWNGFIWSLARQDFWISFAKKKEISLAESMAFIIALNGGHLCLLCTYKNDVAVRASLTSSEGLVAWAQCQLCQHSCAALRDCCEKTANSCISFAHVPLNFGSYPWSLSWTMLPICLHPALHLPGSVPDPHGLRFLVWSWTCRWATMRRPNRLTRANTTSSHSLGQLEGITCLDTLADFLLWQPR